MSAGTANGLFVLLKPLKNKEVVMVGLVPAIHVGPTPEPLLQRPRCRPDVGPRDKPGDDDLYFLNYCIIWQNVSVP